MESFIEAADPGSFLMSLPHLVYRAHVSIRYGGARKRLCPWSGKLCFCPNLVDSTCCIRSVLSPRGQDAVFAAPRKHMFRGLKMKPNSAGSLPHGPSSCYVSGLELLGKFDAGSELTRREFQWSLIFGRVLMPLGLHVARRAKNLGVSLMAASRNIKCHNRSM
jgi:hypothetical protein